MRAPVSTTLLIAPIVGNYDAVQFRRMIPAVVGGISASEFV
jgi:hypothetical protein